MSFPLFQRPGAVVFLDDEPGYLEMLAEVLPASWHVQLFTRPQDCINHLQQEPPRWEADAWLQQQIVDHWRDGTPLVPQILHYWAAEPQRYNLTHVCVFDYAMPGMDGLQALGELVDWPGARALLTGKADEIIAVQAFNRGLIDQFIGKQDPDISRRLIDTIQRLLQVPSPRHDQTWRATLTPAQHALLRVPSVGQALGAFASKHWVEYVVIGDPFGVLGMDGSGKVSWLQLEAEASLADLSELAESQGMERDAVEHVRHGRKLVDLELQQQLGRNTPASLHPAFQLGHDAHLLAALFQIDDASGPGPAMGHDAWLAAQGDRVVRD